MVEPASYILEESSSTCEELPLVRTAVWNDQLSFHPLSPLYLVTVTSAQSTLIAYSDLPHRGCASSMPLYIWQFHCLSKTHVWSCSFLNSSRMDLTLFLDENSSSFSDRGQTQETTFCVISFQEIPRKCKTMETECRLVVACGGHGEVEIKSTCAQRI